MDKASDFGSEDCEFESRRGHSILLGLLLLLLVFLWSFHLDRYRDSNFFLAFLRYFPSMRASLGCLRSLRTAVLFEYM